MPTIINQTLHITEDKVQTRDANPGNEAETKKKDMTRLEDLQPTAAVRGILPDQIVTVVSVQWFGSEALELTYKTPSGRVANELLYRHDEQRLQVVEHGRPWSFDGDGHLFRLVSEAHRIRLAHLFDPVLAVHTSLVEPLPHQITAVYEAMLPRQPLRFLLADDPGAGKTIMAGLFIKELIARGDLQRCLVVCPGSLAEQWQDELFRRFQLPFEILTNEKLEAARTGNWFLENNLVIARLDKLSRNEDVQQKLQVPDCHWDLVVCDEAHKLSATFFGGEVKYTKRYHLGQLLSGLTRHFLFMTATPHNGKEEDFQLFMALLDGDRFEGRFRDGVHQVDISDLMRRMVKETLVKFDGTPLFPERIAYTVPYKLSNAEAQLYKEVTDYVREDRTLGSPPVAPRSRSPSDLSFPQKLAVQSGTDALIAPEKPFGVAPLDCPSPAAHFEILWQRLQQPTGFLADDRALAKQKVNPSFQRITSASINPLPQGIHFAAMFYALLFVPLPEKRIYVFAARI